MIPNTPSLNLVVHAVTERLSKILAPVLLGCVLAAAPATADTLITFDDPTLFQHPHPLQTTTGGMFYDGDPGATLSNEERTNSDGWSYGGTDFANNFTAADFGDQTFTFWDGWSFSNVNNPDTPGVGNQYATITGTGIGGDGFYALAFGNGATFTVPEGQRPASVNVTNTAYTYFSMLNGDSFAKPFGGDTGNDPDFLRVTFRGFSSAGGEGEVTGEVPVFLGDYRGDASEDFLLDTWSEIDLSGLGNARSVTLEFDGTDTSGAFLNTPTYVAIDNLLVTAVPEPSGVAGLILLGTLLYGSARGSRRRRRSIASRISTDTIRTDS